MPSKFIFLSNNTETLVYTDKELLALRLSRKRCGAVYDLHENKLRATACTNILFVGESEDILDEFAVLESEKIIV